MRVTQSPPDRRPGTAGSPASARAAVPRALAAACALALAACLGEDDGGTAGVDDFPNSIYARVEGFLDEKDKADLPAPPGADSLLARGRVKAAAVKKLAADAGRSLPALAKASAARAADTCRPTFTWSAPRPPDPAKPRMRTVETLVVCVDAASLDSIEGNEHIVRIRSVSTDTVTGRVETGELSDADGDGLINPLPDGKERTRVVFTVTEGPVTESTRMVVGYGPDGKWDSEADNLIYSLAWARISQGDTTASAAYSDADGDGVAVDNARPSLVDVDWYAEGPTADNPDAVWSRFRLRTVAVFGVKQGEIRRFALESETRDGRQRSAVLLDLGGGVDIDLRDTVLARFRAVGTAAADTADTLETELEMTLGPDFDAKADDTVYALKVRAVRKLGEEVRAAFDFRSDAPIPHGEEPRLGTLEMRIEYRDGTALDVEGRITESTVDLTAEMRDGKRLRAVWDREGKGISLEELD